MNLKYINNSLKQNYFKIQQLRNDVKDNLFKLTKYWIKKKERVNLNENNLLQNENIDEMKNTEKKVIQNQLEIKLN